MTGTQGVTNVENFDKVHATISQDLMFRNSPINLELSSYRRQVVQ